MKRSVTALCILWLASAAQAASLELKKGDHICLIGNTLAERMQHQGWLETLLYSRFAGHELVFRNLGYSGDELGLRLRSMDFGSPDQWLGASAPVPQPKKLTNLSKVRENRFELTNTKADVVFAFFGYNESFAGAEGLPAFKQQLEEFIRHTASQKYNGHSPPRLVLFSPIAHEDLGDRNLTNGKENNERIKLYRDAMAEVAAANQTLFVDLFTPSLDLYRTSEKPLTINGIHLTDDGERLLAPAIERALFPDGPMIKRDAAALEKIHRAVLDKNFYWFHRYRTTDGFSTYGDRAFLKFTDGQSNYEVVQRELEILDVMTSNRDRRIWSVANGADAAVDDSNTPPPIPVVTNKPGPLPGGKHVFLGGEEAISKMTIHKGMKINLFASEEQFPELISPVQMAFDTKGRLWVATWPLYPHWQPKVEEMNDRLLILEDTDGDGRADKCKTFADHLHNPTGFEFWNGGVLVAMAPDILFIQDTDGDDRADVRRSVLHGLDTADTHHTANSFSLDPGGALYFQEGTFHHSQVETPWGPVRRVANGAVFRYEPRAQKFGIYTSYGFANPHGHAFDHWGQDIVVDGTGAVPFHGAMFSGHVEFPRKYARIPSVYAQRTRPCPAIEFLSSKHFPESMEGNLLVGNVIGFQGILRYKIEDKGPTFGGTEMEPIVSSSDPNFRPVDIETAPDGSLYFTDWQNPIIGHMQHNLRDPSRNRKYGRVYRVTYEGRPLVKPTKIAGEPIEKLLEALKEPQDRVRYRARIELSGRGSNEAIAAVNKWTASLDEKQPEHEHLLLEALWVHQHHNVVDTALLDRVLKSPDFRARAAAARVLCYWRDRVSNSLELFKKLAADEHPRVRLEAIRAASFFTVAEAVEIPLIAADMPTDMYLDLVKTETLKTLDPFLKKVLADGGRPAFTTEPGARYFLRNLSSEQLLEEQRTRPVLIEMLYRPGLRDEIRREAVQGLSKLDGKPELQVVMDAIRYLDEKQTGADISVIFDLVRQLTSRSANELATARAELERLALTSQQPIFRQIGFVSLINVDGQVEPAWRLAIKNVTSLADFVSAMPLISDASVRATLFDKMEPLLEGLPAELAATVKKGAPGRYVRIEIPGKSTLTLAEVEVFSGGENVARKGRAIQKNTAFGGDAQRAIDGNTAGEFTSNSQTHTEVDTNNPYWEVDLNEELPLDEIVIYNRQEEDLGARLNGFTLRVLDNRRNEVFRREKNAAPKSSVRFEMAGSDPAVQIRRAAMTALTYVRGKETKTFQDLARFVREDVDRAAAVKALQRVPRTAWPKEEAPGLLTVLTTAVAKIPAKDRTSPAALDALEFADALAGLLPADEAKRMRGKLSELGVRVVRIGTVFERMAYDKDVVAIKAGKPVEFVLENNDLMPHNFVITQPGSLEEIGLMAEASAQQPAFAKRQFVPQSDRVLASSGLMQPRDSQKLSFVAPKQPGVYPFVCTYPGHWRRMYGALYVVEDLDDYLANPESYLALNPLPIKDALLQDRRPRTEWKYDDLASAVGQMSSGRSFGNGKQMFQVANCVACHRMDNVGTQFGPELSKLEPKWQPADIIREILDPSQRINEKFQSFVFQTDAGKTYTGLIVEETPEIVKIIENPLAKAEPIVLKKSEIEARQRSPVSMMPKGLLDKLTRDEILDLLAFLTARGDKSHAVFQGAGHGHNHNHAP